MSVNVVDRRKSKVEFDNAYNKIFMDAERLIGLHFGAKGETFGEKETFIKAMGEKVFSVVFDIGTHIRIANSIYPKCQKEADERRVQQDKAIGLCFDLLTKYQNTMLVLKIKDDKYIIEIKNLVHEINCLKRWRESDAKRFRFTG